MAGAPAAAQPRNRLQEDLGPTMCKSQLAHSRIIAVRRSLNNMLMAINGYSDRLASGSPLRRDVEQIMASAERAATITRELLAFSRKRCSRRGPST
jgi:signal transduction histidine kinase